MKEFIIFVCTDSTEIFFSNLRSSCSNYNLPSFSLTLTVRGLSNKHCLLTFFINPALNIKMVFGEKIPKMGTFSDFVTIFFVKCYNKI